MTVAYDPYLDWFFAVAYIRSKKQTSIFKTPMHVLTKYSWPQIRLCSTVSVLEYLYVYFKYDY